MIGPVREREHSVDKRAIAEYKASDMGDKSITKVSAAPAPRGPMGQKYLASGIRLSIGREAEAVIFVLGAPSPSQTGARGWAGSHPNLLNVAVTRAKEALYVIGNRDLWCGAGLFRELDHRLPLWPPYRACFPRWVVPWREEVSSLVEAGGTVFDAPIGSFVTNSLQIQGQSGYFVVARKCPNKTRKLFHKAFWDIPRCHSKH
jgi:hypothetical protein